ncbi:MAG TPA: AarF/UbiB family protein [Acidimicrobiales bacterium]|nr:AarF/UbiB family protein [Acidimicrobiales bacterium]
MHEPTILDRVASSAWVAEGDGLLDAVKSWSAAVDERGGLADRAAAATAPGLVPPARALRYGAALEIGRLRFTVGSLLRDPMRPVRDPGGWAKEGVAEMLRHQLGLLGAPGAEIARIIAASEGLLPGVVVDEIRRHPVRVAPLPADAVATIAARAFDGRVDEVSDHPLTVTPVTQVHAARLDGGRRVLVRVRRPGARRDVLADARMTAALTRSLEALVPPLRDSHPLGFVELAVRQAVEELDLRREALALVGLAMALEEVGATGVTVARPVADLATSRALVLEELPGARSFASASDRLDPDAAIAAVIQASLEAGLAVGVFHADIRPEHLVVMPDASLGVVGCGTLGRFDLTTRRAAFGFLTALFSGDHRGQVDAMVLGGAVPDGIDTEALVADLAAAPALSPAAMLSGGGDTITGALGDAVRILLRHRLRPPVDVTMFVRNVFAFRELLATLAPGTSPFLALMPLVQRLPDLQARLEPVR